MLWVRYLVALVAAYLLGAIPTGYVVAKVFKNIDIRKVGSGRIGGSNVLRAVGPVPAALTVLGDLLKGYGAVALAQTLAPGTPLLDALAGVASIVGHNWSAFLGFGGGVGTMTTAGAALRLFPGGTLVSGAVAIFTLLRWRYSSLASLTLSALLTLTCLIGALLGWWPLLYLVFTVSTGVMSAWKLRPNITRLRQGTERKLGQFIKAGQTDVPPENASKP
jgi:glycerol-3-phosphate acyltransferase PlsY